MLPTISESERAWQVIRWGVVAIAVLTAILFVWPGSLPFQPASAYSDAALSHWPNAYFLRQSVWEFRQWPLWNPLHMLGQPFAANPLSKVWYPPQWLVLILPPTFHLNTLIYAHLAWLAWGMMEWVRQEALHPLAAALAALTWALNPKLIAHLGAGHLDILYALAWAPWLFWSIARLHQDLSLTRGVQLGVVAALLFLADVRIAFYMLPVGMLYALMIPFSSDSEPNRTFRSRARSLAPWLIVLVILVLLTAVQTVPLIVLSPYLTRTLITPRDAAALSLPPRYLLGTIIAVGGGHEWITYLGVPVVALAVFSLRLWRRRDTVLWWGIALTALLWSLGDNGPLFLPVIKSVPIAGWFRVPSRAWFVVALALIILSAYSLDAFIRSGMGRRGRLVAVAMSLAGLIWVLASWLMRLQGSLTGAGAALTGTGLGLLVLGRGPSLPALRRWLPSVQPVWIGGGMILATLIASLLLVDRMLIEGRPLKEVNAGDTAILAQLPERCALIYSPSFDLLSPAAAEASIATLHGVDPFQLRGSAEAIARGAGVPVQGYSITAPPIPAGNQRPEHALAATKINYDALADLSVSVVVSRFPLTSERLGLNVASDSFYIYQLVQARTSACYAGPNRLTVTGVPDDSRLILPVSWAPGWRASSGGKALAISSASGLLEVESPPGEGPFTVELRYRPLADYIGIMISGLTTLGLAIGWLVLARRYPLA